MARGKPVILNTIGFDNQTKALTFFQQMLQRYVPGERVSPEDTIHLTELFKRHPSYPEKIGPGVSYFEVMPEKFNSQCFCAVLKNGTKEGFSYKRCVTQKGD
ncbi:DCL family protein [Chitiniphilus purpureus]|uniref:DCL family protein n=1 Tax=Chitiniphilus purpureus TaxID=2981137 RepID=A0ABY6DUL0_9NEIS|nr:DCL family protein [Chitiniphilus sp. CD1]UXY17201.1 DCL family protein [Chitiniphilus sp. CD1]